MEPFPEEWQLLSFFETEPVLADSRVPWAYNCLTFHTERGPDSLDVEIEPGYQQMRLRWSRDGVELMNFDLKCVIGLVVETGNGTELLTVQFRDSHMVPFKLRLKPTIHVQGGTNDSLP